jgi:hypothetical protein
MKAAERRRIDPKQEGILVKYSRAWVAALAAASLGLMAWAAPAPAPRSQGPISDYLRLRAALPPGAPPEVVEVQGDDENIEITHRLIAYEARTEAFEVKVDGKTVTQVRTVVVPLARNVKSAVAVKDCKVYRLGKEGKLEAIGGKAGLWKKPTSVLSGTSAEVDPRHLELVKPGTLFLVLPAPMNVPLEAPVPVPAKKVP